MRKNRKGSMELGVNSIVVLIIALAILGLGIGFITNIFSQQGDAFENIIKRDHLPIHGDSIDPIKLNSEEFTIKNGKTFNNPVSVYNDGRFGENSITLSLSCPDPADTSNPPADLAGQTKDYTVSFTTGSQTIPIGSDSGYKLVMTAKNVPAILDDGENSITLVCTVSATDGTNSVSKQVVLKLTS